MTESPAPLTLPKRRPRGVRGVWQRFWERAPRQLKFTRNGKILVAIALAVGAAAINTGNNLLLLGWGLVLSAIVISGVLSEATLKPLHVEAQVPKESRAHTRTAIPLVVKNLSAHFPAYAVETHVQIRAGEEEKIAYGHFQLRMGPKQSLSGLASFIPNRRGKHLLAQIVASTEYPFGFFLKSRKFLKAEPLAFFAFPAPVDVDDLVQFVTARVGDNPNHTPGLGDEFFALRPFRNGDDYRKVYWRKALKTQRLSVVEHEENLGRVLLLELCVPTDTPNRQPNEKERAASEYAVSAAGSLAEALLAKGLAVGLRGPGTFVLPALGPMQRSNILLALAKMDTQAPLLPAQENLAGRVARIGLVLPPATIQADSPGLPPVDMVLQLNPNQEFLNHHDSKTKAPWTATRKNLS